MGLVQHIKNTDFGYRGHLKHEVPEPYVWDASFSTDYKRLDEEHDVLFADILKVSQDPDSAANLDTLKKNMRLHFDCEQINWAKNWLAQHIKNTDHAYKKRLIGDDQG